MFTANKTITFYLSDAAQSCRIRMTSADKQYKGQLAKSPLP